MLKVENSVGVLVIEDSAIQGVVAKAAEKCFGVAGMIPKNATEEIRAFFNKNFEKGIRVTCVDNEIFIEIHIMVTYGINIPAITESIVHKIAYSVETATGFKVRDVKVFVDSVCANN